MSPIQAIITALIAWRLFFAESCGAQALGADQKLYDKASAKFQTGDYDGAIQLLRKYLKLRRDDDSAWNMIGAAYHHTGLPRRALRYLKSIEKKTSQQTYNLYYQGLAYRALQQPERALRALKASASGQDLYASYSTYELGIFYYRNKDSQLAHYWFATYLNRFPGGPHAPRAYHILEALQAGIYQEELAEGLDPDTESAIFRYSPLSLMDFPHFWIFQIGTSYEERTEKEPFIDTESRKGLLRSTQAVDQTFNADYGFGLGTFNFHGNLLTAGYFYRQIWHTNADRMNIYLEDPLDFEYFAFRADLLERHHQFFFDARRDLNQTFYLGVYGRMEYARIGSSLFKISEDSHAQKTLKLSDTSLLIPWIGMSLDPGLRFLIYYYIRKEINTDEPAFSNQTYDFEGSEPVFSLGLTGAWDLPNYGVMLDLELFHYEFIYNDIFLDYTRDGFLLGVQWNVWQRVYLNLVYGRYEDAYYAEILRQSSCSSSVQEVDNESDPKRCSRVDEGSMYELEAYWNYTQFHRIGLKYTYVENRNPYQQQYDSNASSILFTATMAFPSVSRVSRFTKRFADAAFTKENY